MQKSLASVLGICINKNGRGHHSPGLKMNTRRFFNISSNL